jgi:hypothetical protein
MSNDLLELLTRVAALEPPLYLMGRLAEDVLLHGALSRAYSDVDLLVPRAGLAMRHRQFAQVGLGPLTVQLKARNDQPLALFAEVSGLVIDLWVADDGPAGAATLELPGTGPTQRFRLTLPADTFTYPPTTFAGQPVHTVSPAALAQLRATSARTRHTGDKQARDLAQLGALQTAFQLAAGAVEPSFVAL